MLDAFPHFLLNQWLVVMPALIGFALLYVQGGLLNFGYALWVGLGSYGFWVLHDQVLPYVCSNPCAVSNAWISWSVLLISTVLGVMLVALICAPLLARSTGMAFAMMSLALAELIHVLAQTQPALFGGENGLSLLRPEGLNDTGFTVIASVVAGTALLGYRQFLCSRAALLLMASHDQALRLQILGHSVLRIRAAAIAVAAGFGAISGVLQLWLFERSSDAAFSLDKSYAWVLYGVLGTLLLPKAWLADVRCVWCVVPLSSALLVIGQTWLPRFSSASGLILGSVFLLAVLLHVRQRANSATPPVVTPRAVTRRDAA